MKIGSSGSPRNTRSTHLTRFTNPVTSKIDDVETPEGNAARRAVSPMLTAGPLGAIELRLRILWRDRPTPRAPSGVWEQNIHLRDPRAALRLLRRIQQAPDRELVRLQIEARQAPGWEAVPLPFLAWLAMMRERSAAKKGGARG